MSCHGQLIRYVLIAEKNIASTTLFLLSGPHRSTAIILLCRRFVLIFQNQLPTQHYNTPILRVYCLSGTLYGVFRFPNAPKAVSSPCPTTVEESIGCWTCTPDGAAVAWRARARRPTACCRLRGGYPGVFPNNTAPHPPASSVTAIRTNTCLSGTAHTA